MRFEDFGAQDLTSRGACLGGVQDADVYILILGAEYGMEMGDSGVAATEEEFNVAMERGIPVLVFVKTGITPEPAQQAFMDRVGNYQEGRFWAEFADNAQLGIRVTKALNEQQVPTPPFQQMALAHQIDVAWRSEQAPFRLRGQPHPGRRGPRRTHRADTTATGRDTRRPRSPPGQRRTPTRVFR